MAGKYGSEKRMGKLADRLNDLAGIPSRGARPVADALNEVLERQYDEGVDPTGTPWEELAPRTLKRHGPPPLTHTGEMAGGTEARPASGSGVEVEVPFPGGIHQTGAKKDDGWSMPQRKILPDGRSFPRAWKDAIDAGMRAAFGAKK